MKVKVFTDVMEMRGVFMFIKPQDAEVDGELDDQVAAKLAQMCGAPIKRAFQSTSDDNGNVIIGKRYKPVAILVPETSAHYARDMIGTGKLAK